MRDQTRDAHPQSQRSHRGDERAATFDFKWHLPPASYSLCASQPGGLERHMLSEQLLFLCGPRGSSGGCCVHSSHHPRKTLREEGVRAIPTSFRFRPANTLTCMGACSPDRTSQRDTNDGSRCGLSWVLPAPAGRRHPSPRSKRSTCCGSRHAQDPSAQLPKIAVVKAHVALSTPPLLRTSLQRLRSGLFRARGCRWASGNVPQRPLIRSSFG
jgi:hypothetical protein